VTVSADQKFVSIGDVSVELKKPQHPELVPVKYKLENPPQSLLKHLRWIMQKDLLGQDVFLIGPPGPLRRNVAMMYLEMTQKEVEYVSLSRDTTEMDLKQRREICAGSAIHLDQCAVRAATDGRVLILEGIEKAERNVLPVLNNLLENREMQLDDGRFLMAASRYDKLLQDHTKEELDAWKLVRVHEDFRVIALGLPVPRYQGNPLDPPLRSRFQARDIHPIPFKDHLQLLETVGKGRVPSDSLLKILSFATTMISDETHSLGLPDFPIDNLYAIVRILQAVPSSSIQRLLERLYPHQCMLGNEGQTAVKNALKSFELIESTDSGNRSSIAEIRVSAQGGAAVQLQCGHSLHEIKVLSGTLEPTTESSLNFVSTPFHDEFLADMMQSHLVKDFCIIGPRGCGKSILVRQFADLLGYHVEPIMLYQDMTARDLLQQRTTTPSGDTSWRLSPLVVAALEGSLAVLDGVHRVNAGTFAVLHRLIHDRELSLFDGTRLLRHDRYDEIQNHHQLTDEAMKARGLLRIHPSFRIVALSEPPVIGSSSQQWLNAEQLTMFLFHHMRSMSVSEELHVLSKLVPHMPDMQKIMDWTHKLRESADTSLKSVAASLSTRQLLRIARRLTAYPDENLYDVLQKACLARFLPRLTRTAFEEELNNLGIVPTALPHSVDGVEKSITCGITDGVLRIGNTTVPVFNPENKTKVPDVLFYENAQHLAVMEDMLKDFLLGEHLLLIGNQGVGKNKIVDRFLYLLNRPREYLQLHRDTTVQTLTLQPTVHDGVIVYEDSPLVRAIKLGHVLVVDEADKAPTNVTCILKTLVESGEMHLADGRRIVSASSGRQSSASVIVAHPDFRMFVLANRPGFPFLGNDFFGAMGDTFSCHAVDNPDVNSEMAMLQQYGPHVPEETLRRLVLAFGELRTMADQGLISYPYSTREVVNMVRHLEKFPGEGLVNVVSNVFDFDSYNKELQETILETLHKHGIPIGANPQNLQLAKE
jgi:MoxR-like ATPase